MGAGDLASAATMGMCEATARLVDQIFADNKPGAVFTAGERFKGWYSYELGSWHVVALNSMYLDRGWPQYSPAKWQEQLAWLENDLRTHPVKGTVVYWHYPFL